MSSQTNNDHVEEIAIEMNNSLSETTPKTTSSSLKQPKQLRPKKQVQMIAEENAYESSVLESPHRYQNHHHTQHLQHRDDANTRKDHSGDENDAQNDQNEGDQNAEIENDQEHQQDQAQNIDPYYERVKTVFTTIRQYTNLIYPGERKHRFNPRITRTQLESFQEYLGFQVPDQFLAVYARHNGHDKGHPVQYLYGGEFLTLERIVETIESWHKYVQDIPEGEDPLSDQIDRVHGIEQVSWSPNWLPFAVIGDESEFLCIDMAPNPALGGKVGQIISVSWFVTKRIFICDDLLTFFDILAEKLLIGDVDLVHGDDGSFWNYCSIT